MMKLFWAFLFLTSLNTYTQSNSQKFFKLSSPEKWWVFFHPFKAKKALIITQDALKVTDSISKTNEIKNDINGGQSDAFKHSFWMASLSQTIGVKSSIKLGLAHERGNYKTFKRHQLEDGFVPDKISSDMDLFNNNVGAHMVDKNHIISKSELIERVLDDIKNGKMKIIQKDQEGNFLNCLGEIIPTELLIGTWENDKCLIASNVK